jgi:hypothetical protein
MPSRVDPWGRAAFLLLALTLALVLIRPPDLPNPGDPFAASRVEPLLTSPTPAVHTFLWWNEEIAQRDLGLVEEMGFTWIKDTFAWRDIEIAQDQYDWWRPDRVVRTVNQRGLKLLIRLDRQPFWSQTDGGAHPEENVPPADLDDFGDFCYVLANRYKGRIHAYQVWNEPNLAREWGGQPPNAAEYVELLRVCYQGIKRGDPDALVISAGPAPTGTDLPVAIPDDRFIQEMYDAGGAAYFDMLGVNAPGYAAPPQADPAQVAATPELGGHRWNAFRHVEDIRRVMVENGDTHKQIAILEMGWTTDPIHPEYSWFAVSQQQQAEYLVGAYRYAQQHWQPWIGIMTTIYIAQPYWTPENEEYWWAITYPDWPETRVRPAYEALKGLSASDEK